MEEFATATEVLRRIEVSEVASERPSGQCHHVDLLICQWLSVDLDYVSCHRGLVESRELESVESDLHWAQVVHSPSWAFDLGR